MPTMRDFQKQQKKTSTGAKAAGVKIAAGKSAAKTKNAGPAKKTAKQKGFMSPETQASNTTNTTNTTQNFTEATELTAAASVEQLRFQETESDPLMQTTKRRPGRDDLGQPTEIETEETMTTENDSNDEQVKASVEAAAEEAPAGPKVEINFKGSELLRSRFPQAFNVTEAVATEWLKEGSNFENLPISQPLAQWATQQGLLKAKGLEKKVMESPALEKAAMQALTLGMKAQTVVSQLREKLKK